MCDNKDNNCDGTTDENLLATFYKDGDNDGFGDSNISVEDCGAPNGYVSNSTDCDDDDNTVYPGAPELCDNKDNNCDGTTDENILATFYKDGKPYYFVGTNYWYGPIVAAKNIGLFAQNFTSILEVQSQRFLKAAVCSPLCSASDRTIASADNISSLNFSALSGMPCSVSKSGL